MRTLPIVLLLAAAALADGENLLKNGGFEEGHSGWVLFGFEGTDGFALDGKDRKEGESSLRLTKKGGQSVPRVWINYSLREGQEEGRLVFSAKLRARKLGSATLKFLVYDTADSIALDEPVPDDELRGTFAWKTFEKTFDIPPNAKGGRIFLAMGGGGELWLDDFRLEHVPAKERAEPKTKRKPLEVENGDFELSRAGWNEVGEPAVALDRAVVAEGSSALRVERDGERLFPEAGVEQVVAEIGRARQVTLHGRARSDGRAVAVVVLLAETEQGALVDHVREEVRGDAYREFALKLEVPRHARRLRIFLATLGPGKTWFDGVRLEGK
jgi:hypothetical protein